MNLTDDAIADRVLTRRDRVVDAVLAAVLLLATALTVPLTAGALDIPIPAIPIVAGWAVAVTVPLAFRRSAPTISSVIVVAVFVAGQALAIPEAVVSQIAPFLALYTLGAWSPHRRRATAARIVLIALLVFWFLLAVALSRTDHAATPAAVALSALSTGLYLAAATAFGEAGWRSAMRRAALERRTSELQSERQLTARQAVDLERTRIARELHDVVAHHISVMGVQAGAARRVLTKRPGETQQAMDALAKIEDSSRRAVDELGRTVLALRDADGTATDPSLAPSAVGIDQIEDLVREARDSGLPTAYSITGNPEVVARSTALALHRIAQESLTNVRKHAGPEARATVDLHIDDKFADLTITDSGGGTPRSTPGTGTGQLGMRERAAAAGGTFEAGVVDGAYRVKAVLPVHR